jgi:hypothetical protein
VAGLATGAGASSPAAAGPASGAPAAGRAIEAATCCAAHQPEAKPSPTSTAIVKRPRRFMRRRRRSSTCVRPQLAWSRSDLRYTESPVSSLVGRFGSNLNALARPRGIGARRSCLDG